MKPFAVPSLGLIPDQCVCGGHEPLRVAAVGRDAAEQVVGQHAAIGQLHPSFFVAAIVVRLGDRGRPRVGRDVVQVRIPRGDRSREDLAVREQHRRVVAEEPLRVMRNRRPGVGQRVVDLAGVGERGRQRVADVFTAQKPHVAVLHDVRREVETRRAHRREIGPRAVDVATARIGCQPHPVVAGIVALHHDRAIGQQQHRAGEVRRLIGERGPCAAAAGLLGRTRTDDRGRRQANAECRDACSCVSRIHARTSFGSWAASLHLSHCPIA